MKINLLLVPILAMCSSAFGQMDTIYTNNEKLGVNVREITEDAVKYSYPNEDLINTTYKNSIQKIIYKNGRAQTFNEAKAYKQVQSINDFENVSVTTLESDVKGLYKIGLLGATDLGSIFSNTEKVKDFAIKKIKMQAAMLGANVVYITDSRNDGAKYGGYLTGYKGPESSISGVAYTTNTVNFGSFLSKIGDKQNFEIVTIYSLAPNARSIKTTEVKTTAFQIIEIVEENGLVTIEGRIKNEKNKFILAYFDNEYFYLYNQNKRSKSFQYKIKF